MEIRFFNDSIEKFIIALQPETKAKIARTFKILERFGNQLGMPHSKKITARIFELRVPGDQTVRLLYTFFNGEAIILNCFVKQSQKLPHQALALAKQRLALLDHT